MQIKIILTTCTKITKVYLRNNLTQSNNNHPTKKLAVRDKISCKMIL